MNHTILVTGADGQLGREMQIASRGSRNRFIFTDIAGEHERLDITDPQAIADIVRENHVNVIVNCAAYTNVDKAETDPETANLLNNIAAGNLADAMKAVNGTLIHISTDYVFQGDMNIPCREDWPTEPLGVYGKTKLAGEKSIEATGCASIIIRTAWLYSPFGNNFVKTMRDLTSSRESLKVVFDQVGTPTYAGDLAETICRISETGQLDKTGIYHFRGGGGGAWFDFAKAICERSGNTCDIRPCHSDEFPSPVARPHVSVLDKTKIKQTFGIRIPYWTDSLKLCIEEIENS